MKPYATNIARVFNREDLGSWISGPPKDPNYQRGQSLGVPATGIGSVAGLGRRIGAICVDWLLCMLISHAFFAGNSWATLSIFGAMLLLLGGTANFTVGYALFGLRLVAIDRGRVNLIGALVRTVLLLLVIPAVIWDRDGRGLHDRASQTFVMQVR